MALKNNLGLTSSADLAREEDHGEDANLPSEEIISEDVGFTLPPDEEEVPRADEAEPLDDAAAPEESATMSWAEFVEMDDARKAAKPAQKNFWEKW